VLSPAEGACSADDDALFAEPALGRFALALQNHSVALQARRHVVPRRHDEFVFAPQRLDFGLKLDLLCVRKKKK
jgi:hypothetical protein